MQNDTDRAATASAAEQDIVDEMNESAAAEDGFSLELDDLITNLDAFQLFRKSDESEAGRVLQDIGAHSDVDNDIVLELSSKRPLGHADRFLEAHSLAVRSLEVLDRNGHRSIPVPNLSILSPVAAFLVQLVTQYLVRSYLSKAIDEMRQLYIRREAAALPGDPHLPLLTRTRIHAERLTPGFKKNALGVPTFLFGGAIISGVGGIAQVGLRAAVNNPIVRIILAVLFVLIIGVAAWVIVHGTAVARRRINLTTRKPMDALWQTIGRAGHAPRDSSKAFAVIAIILTLASFILIPALAVIILTAATGGDASVGDAIPS